MIKPYSAARPIVGARTGGDDAIDPAGTQEMLSPTAIPRCALRDHGSMWLSGERITASRMLLLNAVEFEPGCLVFELDGPLMLLSGDRLWREDGRVVVERVSGTRQYPSGTMTTVKRAWRLR